MWNLNYCYIILIVEEFSSSTCFNIYVHPTNIHGTELHFFPPTLIYSVLPSLCSFLHQSSFFPASDQSGVEFYRYVLFSSSLYSTSAPSFPYTLHLPFKQELYRCSLLLSSPPSFVPSQILSLSGSQAYGDVNSNLHPTFCHIAQG